MYAPVHFAHCKWKFALQLLLCVAWSTTRNNWTFCMWQTRFGRQALSLEFFAIASCAARSHIVLCAVHRQWHTEVQCWKIPLSVRSSIEKKKKKKILREKKLLLWAALFDLTTDTSLSMNQDVHIQFVVIDARLRAYTHYLLWLTISSHFQLTQVLSSSFLSSEKEVIFNWLCSDFRLVFLFSTSMRCAASKQVITVLCKYNKRWLIQQFWSGCRFSSSQHISICIVYFFCAFRLLLRAFVRQRKDTDFKITTK